MMKVKLRYPLIGLGIAALVAFSAQAFFWKSEAEQSTESATARVIGWEDLVPAGFIPPANPLDQMSTEQVDKLFDGSEESKKELEEIQEMLAYAPTVQELDGEQVKIPAYVVPLDYDGQTNLKEFLLVPYYGACVHTPPPPANQVVHAHAEQTITVEDTYNPVWAIGTIKTETIQSDLAESGYQLDVQRIEPYDILDAN